MKKVGIGICVTFLLSSLLAGCGNAIPEMSEEQQTLIVEYAAGTVLKYDKKHDHKLLDVSMLPKEEINDDDVAGDMEDEEILSQEGVSSDMEATVEASEMIAAPSIEENEPMQNSSIEEVLQLDDFTFQYTGFELKQDYPDEGEELYFVMSASEGNELLVLKFMAENVSDADAELNINQIGARFKIAVDEEQKNVLTTLLLNDLAHYQGTLAPGESTELVLVREITDQHAETFTNLSLIVKNVDNTATISLN